ncbi:DnaA/Hda family protein [Desulfonatronovibrio hydrogenovorans]|uniref:DnaA/Hda family protein n=1 Tax=Desulfonatronovibrio hydrogenovorans TaxID=53245 RepID=UPI00137779EA|nr:DnaA/Hda family protein [Desulfonatronovibrio hydrogenovorans]
MEKAVNKKIKYLVNGSKAKFEKKSAICNKCINNLEYTFKNFIPGKKNQIPLKICKEISRLTEVKYNPVIIYGESSSGKTHLAWSIVNSSFNKRIYFTDVFEVNHHINENKTAPFFENIKDNDVAIVEDVHELKKEDKTSKLIQRMIDYFYENKKQLILTYNGKKINNNKFSEELKNRINSGLILKIIKPDLKVRTIYAKQFCAENKIKLSSDNIFTIARNCDNIRSIKGVLLKLTTFANREGNTPEALLDKMLLENRTTPVIDFNTIINEVCSSLNVSPEDIQDFKKGKKICQARQISMYFCRSVLNWSYPKIGSRFGGRDHSTAIYSIKKIKKLKDVDPNMNILLSEMFQRIKKSH